MDNATETRTDVWANLKKVHGTSGRLNYALIALQGNIALSVTMQPPMPVEHGGKQYLRYALHVRSAKLRSDELEGLELDNVQDITGNLSGYWPGFVFQQIDGKRASGDLVAYFPGHPRIENGELILPDCLKDGAGAKVMVDKLLEIASPGKLVVNPDDLIELYRQRDQDIINQITQAFEASKERDTLIEQSAGSAISEGAMAQALKDAYNEKHGISEDAKKQEGFVADADEDEDEDADSGEGESDD